MLERIQTPSADPIMFEVKFRALKIPTQLLPGVLSFLPPKMQKSLLHQILAGLEISLHRPEDVKQCPLDSWLINEHRCGSKGRPGGRLAWPGVRTCQAHGQHAWSEDQGGHPVRDGKEPVLRKTVRRLRRTFALVREQTRRRLCGYAAVGAPEAGNRL